MAAIPSNNDSVILTEAQHFLVFSSSLFIIINNNTRVKQKCIEPTQKCYFFVLLYQI